MINKIIKTLNGYVLLNNADVLSEEQKAEVKAEIKYLSELDSIDALRKRIDMLQDALIEAISPTPKKDLRVTRKDFIQMYDKCTSRMFDDFDKGIEGGPNEKKIYNNDVTVHWNGIYCDCSDGAIAWNHIIEGVKGVDSEEGDEL